MTAHTYILLLNSLLIITELSLIKMHGWQFCITENTTTDMLICIKSCTTAHVHIVAHILILLVGHFISIAQKEHHRK
jgi:hypothetical protein